MVFIVGNLYSGGGKAVKALASLRNYLQQEQIHFTEYLTLQSKDYQNIRTAFLKSKAALVISCGGDGTANEVINALYMPEYQNNTPLLVLPAGSGNDFSTQLYGKQAPTRLFGLIKNFETKRVDLGVCNEQLFLNGIGIGFDGFIAKSTSANKNSLLPTSLKYYLAIFKNVFFYGALSYKKNNESFVKEAFIVAIANGSCYGGGFAIAPKATLDDGLLDVVEIGKVAWYKRPFYIPMVEQGRHLGLSFVRHNQVKKITLHATQNMHIPAHADGEFFEANTFNLQVLPLALPVAVWPK